MTMEGTHVARIEQTIVVIGDGIYATGLVAALRADFQVLRRLRGEPSLAGVPILVSSPGTVTDDPAWLERRLRPLDVRLLLEPHDLEAILGEMKVLARAVA